MPSEIQTASVSKASLWTGRVISVLIAVFMIFDGLAKILKAKSSVEGTVQLGYPIGAIVPIGLAAFICAVVYLIPRTSILGAILLTGYLGGATASMVRAQNPWFVFPVIFGVLAWLGLYLRDQGLRAMIACTQVD
jgi:hypothetical protein